MKISEITDLIQKEMDENENSFSLKVLGKNGIGYLVVPEPIGDIEYINASQVVRAHVLIKAEEGIYDIDADNVGTSLNLFNDSEMIYLGSDCLEDCMDLADSNELINLNNKVVSEWNNQICSFFKINAN